MTLVLISVFGIAGILSRYGVDQMLIGTNWGTGSYWPWSTFFINTFGSFVAAIIFFWATRRSLSPEWSTALLVGYCGGFTTFSAYALQTFSLIEQGRLSVAALYLTLSPIAALIGVVFARTLIS